MTYAQIPTSLGRPQDYDSPSGTGNGNGSGGGGVNGNGEVLAPKSFTQEPTCEELRAMWR